MKALNVKAGIDYAKSQFFSPDARVRGVLVNADIGHISYGELHGGDRPAGQEFVRFECVGTDNRNGYDIVQAADGVAYVVLTYAEHAKDRGMSGLKKHIAVNPEYYAARKAATWN